MTEDAYFEEDNVFEAKLILSIKKEVNYTLDSDGKCISANWGNTIFAMFEHMELKTELESWAREHDCFVSWGTAPTDIIAVPFFISIIDRQMIGEEGWSEYLEFVKAVNSDNQPLDLDDEIDQLKDDSTCIIVDRCSWELPIIDTVLIFDLRDREAIPAIIDIVEKRHQYGC